MPKKLLFLDDKPQICCENCQHEGSDCNANMLYATCLSRGHCKWQGAIDPDEDFCYSEFKPVFMHSVAFLPVEMVEVPKEFLETIYDEAFRAGVAGGFSECSAMKSIINSTVNFKGIHTYHPEFVISE